MKKKLVVIGNGMAGARVVEEILQRSPDLFDITMFGAERYGNYNRIQLSNVLNGSQTPEETFMNPLSWYQENGVTLHAGVKAYQIDRKKKLVMGHRLAAQTCPYGQEENAATHDMEVQEPYDHVIIATGSRPFLPPIQGYGMPGTFMFRTLDDCDRIAAYARNCHRASVIGGGLLGLEAARGLITHGVQVTVIEAGPRLMAAQLDDEGGRLLKSTMEAMGIRVMLNTLTSEIQANGHGPSQLHFQGGTTLDTDMVVVSAGIRPITEVAQASGLKVNKGIVCNDQMQTSDPDIFALGECVEHRGQLFGLVEPIWEMARVLSDSITGNKTDVAFASPKLGTKLKVMGVELVSMGQTEAQDEHDEVTVYREPRRGIYQKLLIRDNTLVGAIMLGECSEADSLMRLFREESKVPEKRTELLFGVSNVPSLMAAVDLPDQAQICNCNGVSKADIVTAIQQEECCSVAQVAACTKAGKGCGSCKGMIAQLIEAYTDGIGYDPSEHYYVPGVPLEKSQLIAAIQKYELKSVSQVFEKLAGGREDADSKVGLASLLRSIWNEEYEDERDARFINDRVHANIQRNGTYSVVPRIYGGVTSPDELIRIGEVAKKYRVPMVKITGGQRIDLLGVSKENLPKIWKELGIPSGHAYTKAVRTVKSCVGTTFCRFGLGDSIKLAQDIERRYQGIESPHKVKLAAAGCPRNCSEAYVKDIGAVAIEGGQWEIYIGGAAGGTVRKGDLLCTVDTHEEVLQMVGRFIQYYREHGKYMERTYDFVERIGIDRLKGILVADNLGICHQLDENIAQAVATYQDPWKEAELPAYPSQFEGPELVRVLEEANNNG